MIGLRVVAVLVLALAGTLPAQSPARPGAERLPLLLRQIDHTRRALVVVAHPDDEDSGLMAWLRWRLGAEVALLTLTRGEGGQNEIGPELFHALGVLRSRELEAAHEIDGARQFFTRAFEFGYSFSVEETNEKWGPEGVLYDLVAVVRRFRPDVVITLSPTGPGGGQHHQASARLAREAVERGADDVWSELGPPHRVRRVFREIWEPVEVDGAIAIDLGVYDPVLGTSFAELRSRARSSHKCQGMARAEPSFAGRVVRLELLWSSAPETARLPHPFAGLPEPDLDDAMGPTELGRVLRAGARDVRAAHRVESPAASAPALVELLRAAAMETERTGVEHPGLATLRERLGAAIALAWGLEIQARTESDIVAPGSELEIEIAVRNALGPPLEVEVLTPLPVLLGVGRGETTRRAIRIRAPEEPTVARPVPEGPTAPADVSQLDPAWDAAAFRVRSQVTWQGVAIPLPTARLERHLVDAGQVVRRRDVHVVPDPAVRPRHPVIPVPTEPGTDHRAVVELLVSTVRGGAVEVEVDITPPWSVEPARLTVATPPLGEPTSVRVTVKAPFSDDPPPARLAMRARRPRPSPWSHAGYRVIDHPHIRRGLLLEPALARLEPIVVRRPATRVAYVEGTGDRVAKCIELLLGRAIPRLDAAALAESDLDAFDVIVLGVRAYLVRPELAAAHPRLVAWMARGGTLVCQYHKLELNDGRAASPWAPHPSAAVGRGRVTVEESPVRVLVPDHPLLTTPNPLGARDWEGWVQERGLYFLETSGAAYVDLVELEDPWPYNAGPKRGALVEARVGAGRWIYVGLALFRQLPAGVDGAWRLLANLLAGCR